MNFSNMLNHINQELFMDVIYKEMMVLIEILSFTFLRLQ